MIEKIMIILFIIIGVLLIVLFSYNHNKDEYKSELIKYNYNNLQRLKKYETEKIIRAYKGENNKIVQVVKVEGYKGDIEFLVETNNDYVTNVIILNQHETEDYGALVTEKWFLKRLYLSIDQEIKVVKMAKKNKNEVVAITGATITTDGVVDGLNLCIENLRRINDEK
jgi:Na+-translocating ferredoxin:NAD+ oxidoreductase RnfG subunit